MTSTQTSKGATFAAYLVTPPVGAREWGTVKAEADRRARELGGKAEAVDLPATKAGLIPFLNELEQQHVVASDAANARAAAPASTGDQAAPAPASLPSPAPASIDFDQVVDWLIGDAAQWQVERVFEALGCRWAEMVRRDRASAELEGGR